MRQMSVRKCKETGNLKSDLVYGDSLMMPNRTVVASKQARIGILACGMRLCEYLERLNDVGCEQTDCLSRGMLVKIGENLARECNDHIGIRIMHATDLQKATSTKCTGEVVNSSQKEEKQTSQTATHKMADNGNAGAGVVLVTDEEPGPNIAQMGARKCDGVSTTAHVRSKDDLKPRKGESALTRVPT